MANKNALPYLVHELTTHKDFVDVKQLAADIGVNISTNSNRETVRLTKTHLIKVEKISHSYIFTKPPTQKRIGKPLILKNSTFKNSQDPHEQVYLKYYLVFKKLIKQSWLLMKTRKGICSFYYKKLYSSVL